jgi:hypothetical protein
VPDLHHCGLTTSVLRSSPSSLPGRARSGRRAQLLSAEVISVGGAPPAATFVRYCSIPSRRAEKTAPTTVPVYDRGASATWAGLSRRQRVPSRRFERAFPRCRLGQRTRLFALRSPRSRSPALAASRRGMTPSRLRGQYQTLRSLDSYVDSHALCSRTPSA